MASTATAPNSRIVLNQVGLVVVGGFSTLILLSFGGQLIVAPALLPAQWLIARNTQGATSVVFSILGAALTTELAWITLGLVAGSGDLPVPVVGILMLVGIGIGVLFYRHSRPPNKGLAFLRI